MKEWELYTELWFNWSTNEIEQQQENNQMMENRYKMNIELGWKEYKKKPACI